MADKTDTARAEGIALGLAMAAQKARLQRHNLNALTSMPPQSAAAWAIEKAILALAPIPPHVAAARVLLDDWDRVGDQRRAGTHKVRWGEVWYAMTVERRELDWNDWPAIFLAALEQIAKEGE